MCLQIILYRRGKTANGKITSHTGVLPGMRYIYGGGKVSGSPQDYLTVIRRFIDTKACVIIAQDCTKAIEAPSTAVFNNCYSTLLWMNESTTARNQQFSDLFPTIVFVGDLGAFQYFIKLIRNVLFKGI